MNPRKLVYVLGAMRENIIDRVPWIGGGPSAKCIALRKDRGWEQDWFTVSPTLYETVCELYDKLVKCLTPLSQLKTACDKCGIKGER